MHGSDLLGAPSIDELARGTHTNACVRLELAPDLMCLQAGRSRRSPLRPECSWTLAGSERPENPRYDRWSFTQQKGQALICMSRADELCEGS